MSTEAQTERTNGTNPAAIHDRPKLAAREAAALRKAIDDADLDACASTTPDVSKPGNVDDIARAKQAADREAAAVKRQQLAGELAATRIALGECQTILGAIQQRRDALVRSEAVLAARLEGTEAPK